MRWKIEKYSNRRLEAEIASVYYTAAKDLPNGTVYETGLLAALWAEFDRRVEAGTMTDDTEAVMDTNGRWIG